jgi:hypothetical protein
VHVVWARAIAVLPEAAAPSHDLFGTVQSASLLSISWPHRRDRTHAQTLRLCQTGY